MERNTINFDVKKDLLKGKETSNLSSRLSCNMIGALITMDLMNGMFDLKGLPTKLIIDYEGLQKLYPNMLYDDFKELIGKLSQVVSISIVDSKHREIDFIESKFKY